MAGDRSLEAAIGNTLAGLRAMRGDFDEARELWLAARNLYEELGLNFRRAARAVIAAQIETLAGDDEAAERSFAGPMRRSSGWARRERGRRSRHSWPNASTSRGDDEEAESFTEITEELAADDDLEPQVLWRSVRAKVLAKRGQLEQAEKLAREAAELVEGTDFPTFRRSRS